MMDCTCTQIVINGFREAYNRDPFSFKKPFCRTVRIIPAYGHQHIDLVTFKILQNLGNPGFGVLY